MVFRICLFCVLALHVTARESSTSILWGNTPIPAKGEEYCVYTKLPEDETYHATDFTWTPSKHPNWNMMMVFTISDQAVAALQGAGYDLDKPITSENPQKSCGMALILAQQAGGYLIFQQGGYNVTMAKDEGFLLGQGTTRRHAFTRWNYGPHPKGLETTDEGTGMRIGLTTELRPKSVGESKFETFGTGNLGIWLPPGMKSVKHIVQCTKEAAATVFRGDGLTAFKVKPLGSHLVKVRVLEAKGGGSFSEPDYQQYDMCSIPHKMNHMLEQGNFQEIFSMNLEKSEHLHHEWVTLNESQWFNMSAGNSYRLECEYDTTGLDQHITNAFNSYNATGCGMHYFYLEKAGNNEPYPGYCMDGGAWMMRADWVADCDRKKEFEKWYSNPSLPGSLKNTACRGRDPTTTTTTTTTRSAHSNNDSDSSVLLAMSMGTRLFVLMMVGMWI